MPSESRISVRPNKCRRLAMRHSRSCSPTLNSWMSPGHVVSENRGSGLPRGGSKSAAGRHEPHPHSMSQPGRVSVTVPQHALLSVEVIDWIGSLGINDLTDVQHLALAIMNSTGRVTNAMLQAWGIDRISAGNALRDLVERNVALPSGGRRYAVTAWHRESENTSTPRVRRQYRQYPFPARSQSRRELARVEVESLRIADAIKQAIRSGYTTARQIGEALAMDYHAVLRQTAHYLQDRGEVVRTRPQHSRSQTYALIQRTMTNECASQRSGGVSDRGHPVVTFRTDDL